MRHILAGLVTAWALSIASITAIAGPAHASDCVTRSEYHQTKRAWRIEGMTRHGVHRNFGFDGNRAWVRDGTMKRRYQGCSSRAVVVKYKHFAAAPGPKRVWWVVRMQRAG